MIQLKAFSTRHFGLRHIDVKPTMFPDGTSQVWKLPADILTYKYFQIIWRFQEEREIFDVLSLAKILPDKAEVHLHMPYLPFARQDKAVSNSSTFNLEVFADIINTANFDRVTSVDTHNPQRTQVLIRDFSNIEVTDIHHDLIKQWKPDCVVFPDNGAYVRYKDNVSPDIVSIFYTKTRDQASGNVRIVSCSHTDDTLRSYQRFLIIDDICDGGATFEAVAAKIKTIYSGNKIGLFVTHGIFSKGKDLRGIDEVFTTNSLPRNDLAHFQV